MLMKFLMVICVLYMLVHYQLPHYHYLSTYLSSTLMFYVVDMGALSATYHDSAGSFSSCCTLWLYAVSMMIARQIPNAYHDWQHAKGLVIGYNTLQSDNSMSAMS